MTDEEKSEVEDSLEFNGEDSSPDQTASIDEIISDLESNFNEQDDDEDDDLDHIPSWTDDQEAVQETDDLLDEKNEDIQQKVSDDIQAILDQRDSYIEALRQLQADFENYKKRVKRDQEEYAELKNTKLIEDLLPVIDSFNIAIDSIADEGESQKIRKGIELVFNDFYSLLEKNGLEKISSLGEKFDPNFHDAVMHEETGEHEHDVVIEVFREGYKVRERVIRPAMVKVAR